MQRARLYSVIILGILLVSPVARATRGGAEVHGVKARWQKLTRLVRGADHRFFLQVAESIQREGRRLELSGKPDALSVRAGEVHEGISYLLEAKNTRSAGPVELRAERRDAKAGTLQQRHLYEEQIVEPGKMPQRQWRQSVVHEERVDRLPPHLAKLLTASSPLGRRPKKGDRLRRETTTVEGEHERFTVTLFAAEQHVMPVSIEIFRRHP